MTVNFQLNQQDFLRYQLFTASQSKKLKQFRFRKRITFPVVFLFFGVLSQVLKLPFSVSLFFLGAALLWFIVYAFWDKVRYQKRFKKFVNKNYAERFGKQVSIAIEETKIVGNDNGFEIMVKAKEIEEIMVIPKLILIKIDDERVMLAATEKIQQADLFKKELGDFAERWHIPFKTIGNWKF